MDVFSLTETEFFRKLTYGENDNLHIAYKEFVLQVSELCNKEPHKGCVISGDKPLTYGGTTPRGQ